MGTLQPAQPRMTKTDMVFAELRQQLLSGERSAGEVLSTYDLAREFGVSRRPVMDAVARLQGAGFLEVVSQVGCRVVLPTTRDLLHHMEVSSALNATAARIAARRITPAALRTVERICAELDDLVAATDAEAFDHVDIDFHRAVVAGTDNPRLMALTDQAWDLTRFFRYPRPVQQLPQLQQEHREIVEAIARGDGDTAGRVMELHQSHARDRVGDRHEESASA